MRWVAPPRGRWSDAMVPIRSPNVDHQRRTVPPAGIVISVRWSPTSVSWSLILAASARPRGASATGPGSSPRHARGRGSQPRSRRPTPTIHRRSQRHPGRRRRRGLGLRRCASVRRCASSVTASEGSVSKWTTRTSSKVIRRVPSGRRSPAHRPHAGVCPRGASGKSWAVIW